MRDGTNSELSLLPVELDDLATHWINHPQACRTSTSRTASCGRASCSMSGRVPKTSMQMTRPGGYRLLVSVPRSRTRSWRGSSTRSRTLGLPHDCGMRSADRRPFRAFPPNSAATNSIYRSNTSTRDSGPDTTFDTDIAAFLDQHRSCSTSKRPQSLPITGISAVLCGGSAAHRERLPAQRAAAGHDHQGLIGPSTPGMGTG